VDGKWAILLPKKLHLQHLGIAFNTWVWGKTFLNNSAKKTRHSASTEAFGAIINNHYAVYNNGATEQLCISYRSYRCIRPFTITAILEA